MNNFSERFEQDIQAFGTTLGIPEEKINTIKTYTLGNEKKSHSLIQRIMTIIGTVVGSLLIGFSVLFLMLTDMSPSGDGVLVFIAFFALIVFCLPSVFFVFKRLFEIGYTLYIIGMITISIVTSISFHTDEVALLLVPVWTVALVYGYIMYHSRGIKLLLLICFQAVLVTAVIRIYDDVFADIDEHFDVVCLTMMGINAFLFTLSVILKTGTHLQQVFVWRPLKYSSAFYFYLGFFILTFFYRNHDERLMYYVYNACYFIFSTGLLLYYLFKNVRVLKVIAILYWFAFIFYKYYDLFWKLFHKSLVLILLGIIFLATAIVIGKIKGVFHHAEK